LRLDLKKVGATEMVEMLIQDMAVGQCLNIEQIFETRIPGTTINFACRAEGLKTTSEYYQS
jgi:hypothetical protein